MSPDGSIIAANIWKRFHSDRRRRNLKERIGQAGNQVLRREKRGWTWALRDVDVVARPGESIGLVGTNGSGKSTLLKILTRVMYPHSGRLEVVGRVGALDTRCWAD